MQRLSKHRALWVLSFSIILLTSIIFSLERWQSFVAIPLLTPASDHITLSSMYLKASKPSLFVHDYVFGKDDYLSFYTPSFNLLARLASNETNYPEALLRLGWPITFLYMLAFVLMVRYMSLSWSVAILVTLIATWYRQSVVIDNWTLYGLPLPRTLAMPAVVATVYTWWRAITSQQSTPAWWISSGALLGVTMNLHPTTGLALALALGLMAVVLLLTRGSSLLFSLLLWGISTLIVALPILLNLAQRSTSILGQTETDFKTVAEVFILRAGRGMLPTANNYFFNLRLQPEAQVILGLIWMPLSLVLGWRSRHSRVSLLLLSLLQLIYAWLVMYTLPIYATLLLGLGLAWAWLRDSRHDKLLCLWALTVGCIIFVSWPLPMMLRVIWWELEIRSLAMFVAELSRGTRLLVVPIYALIAFILGHLLQEVSRFIEKRWPALYHRVSLSWSEVALLSLALAWSTISLVQVMARPVEDNRNNPAAMPPLVQLALWAEKNTPIDAIFAYATTSTAPSDMSLFRYYAQRAVSHSHKDLSMVAYSHAEDLPALYERQLRFAALSQTPEGVLQLMKEANAEYLVINYNKVPFESAHPELKELLRIGSFALYQRYHKTVP